MYLNSTNIQLRAIEPEDLAFLYTIENDVSLWEVSNTTTPFSKYALKQYLANAQQDIYQTKQVRLVIEHQKKPIGLIDLFDFDPKNKHAGVGILLTKAAQKKGFATEALTILIKYAFTILNLHQLYANITSDNKNSIQLFENAGFKKTGTKIDWIVKGDTYKDEFIYQLLNKQ